VQLTLHQLLFQVFNIWTCKNINASKKVCLSLQYTNFPNLAPAAYWVSIYFQYKSADNANQ
jgi:hypothetical protein